MTVSLSTMSYTEKIDVLELLIDILVEHDERLDELVARLELLFDHLDVEGSVPEAVLVGNLSDKDAIEDMK